METVFYWNCKAIRFISVPDFVSVSNSCIKEREDNFKFKLLFLYFEKDLMF